MTLYTVADVTSQCYGHGDYGKEQRICRQGAYGSGDFPPLFRTREEAKAWIESSPNKYLEQVVVSLELREPQPIPQPPRAQ